MKKIIQLLFLCFSFITFSQSKQFTIVDAVTKKPIDLAQIVYPDLELGSITNKEGNIKIPLKEKDIHISHVNYQSKTISFLEFVKKDSLFLKPKINSLDEVVIYNLNIKEKITKILDKTFLKNYSTRKSIHKATYKETFKVNNSLSRLFQVQLNWYSKESLFKFNKPIEKQNKINIISVDYSKLNKNDSKINANGAHLENKIFFRFIHLNFLLSILKDLTDDFDINSIEKNNNSNTVYFDAVVAENKKEIYRHQNSYIVFNKDYTFIKHLKFNMIYSTDFKDDIIEKSKMPYKKKTTAHILELSFKPLKNKKHVISFVISELKAIIKTKNFTNKINTVQNLFITETILGKKIRKSNVDFFKPFYKNLPKDIKTGDSKILLTKEEQKFLNSKSN